MDPGILEKTGLSKNEARTYLILLEEPLNPCKRIIEKTRLHRQLVYDALDSLIAKGLASYIIQANRKYFKAADPKLFKGYFTAKEQGIKEQKDAFLSMLPQLEKLRQENLSEQEATIYLGNKGIVSLLDDMIHERKEILTIGSSDIAAEAFQYHLKFNLPKFHKARSESKIPMKIIFGEELRKRAQDIGKERYTQSRILPREFTSNVSTNIYADKVSIILWGSQPFGILIKSREIAKAQKNHFDILWKIGKKP